MLFFLAHGYRVIAHDRGHGRSAQVSEGHDMDHYADDLAALTAHLDLKNAIHVGHSTGGGEVAHDLAARREPRRDGGADQRGAAADGADRGQSRRTSQSGVRRSASGLRAAVGEACEERDAEDYKGFPHGMPTTQADVINADLLAFVRG
jgi:pimeloyl-ACP methyl ester carboxylesterase